MRYLFLVFFAGCSYGILSTIVKLAYSQGYSPDQVIGGSAVFGFLLTWIPASFFLATRPPVRKLALLAAAGVVSGATAILYYNALQYIPASLAIVLLFQFTWMGVLADAIMERRRPDRIRMLALLLLMGGTLLAGGVLEEGGTRQFHPLGVILGLLSAVTYTLFIIFSGKIALEVNSFLRSSSMATGSLLLNLFIYPPVFLFDGSLGEGLFPYVFLLALFGVLIPNVCMNYGVPRVGPGMASILASAELPVAVLSSRLVLQEDVSWLQAVGVGIILLGMALPRLAQRQQPKNAGGSS